MFYVLQSYSEIASNKYDEEFLKKIIDIVEKDKNSEYIDVTTLCREVAMSRSVLYRKLKALTGHSIQDFVRIIKLKKAAKLLLESNLWVTEIAYQSGFTNAKHFSSAFRKQFSKTPSEFRQHF